MRKLATLYVLLTVMALSWSQADEGRIPIFQRTIITQPGHYVLTRNFTSLVNPAIDVQSDDVTIDLNGHTITSQSGVDSIVLQDGQTNLVVRNGRITGGRTAFDYGGGTTGGAHIRIREIEIYGVDEAIHFTNPGYVEVVSCDIRAANDSIYITSTNPFTGRILNNTLVNPVLGLYLDGMENGTVRGNIILDDDQSSVQIVLSGHGCVVEKNVVTSLAHSGLYNGVAVTGNDNYLVGNIVRGSGQVGIIATGDRNKIEGNKVHDSGVHGLLISGAYADIYGNDLNSNGGACLEFAQEGNHVYRDNFLRGCTSGPWGGYANTDGGRNIY